MILVVMLLALLWMLARAVSVILLAILAARWSTKPRGTRRRAAAPFVWGVLVFAICWPIAEEFLYAPASFGHLRLVGRELVEDGTYFEKPRLVESGWLASGLATLIAAVAAVGAVALGGRLVRRYYRRQRGDDGRAPVA